MRATWYILEDGSAVDPFEVAPNSLGVLCHKSGVAVAMRGNVPSTRGVDPDQERAKSRTASETKPKDMKAEDSKRPYRTRETKAE